MRVRREGAALIGLALLVGCGPGAQPVQLPVVTRPVAVLKTAPAQATADSPAGAAAFTRFFYEQVTAAFANRDATQIRALALASCTTCNRYAESVAGMVTERQRVTPVLFWIRFAESPADEDATSARVDVQYDAPASTRYDAAGRVVFTEKAIRAASHTVTLRRVGRGWKVAGIA